MAILIVDNVEPQDAAFNDPIRDCIAKHTAVSSVNYRDVPAADVINAQFDGVIISGAPLHYDNDVIDSRLPFMQWVMDVTKPVLGICLGHQNLSRLFGGDMLVDIEAEDGSCPLTIMRDDSLLAGLTSGDEIRGMHRVSVTLPAAFHQLARTEACNNQAMKHITRPIYGVQFHPELSKTGHTILDNFANLAAQAQPTHPALATMEL